MGGLERQVLLDAGKAGGNQRRKRKIGIEIGAANTALDADGLGVGAAQPEAGGAVVERPDRPGRREGADLEALIGIDIGREEPGDLPRISELPGDEAGASGATCRAPRFESRKSGVLPALSHSEVWIWLDEPARS